MTTQRIFISGKVQNIGFRNWVMCKARDLGVTGWVRNLTDGRVEVLVAGDDEAANALVEACRQGSPHSRVDHVEALPDEEKAPKGFTKRFTASVPGTVHSSPGSGRAMA